MLRLPHYFALVLAGFAAFGLAARNGAGSERARLCACLASGRTARSGANGDGGASVSRGCCWTSRRWHPTDRDGNASYSAVGQPVGRSARTAPLVAHPIAFSVSPRRQRDRHQLGRRDCRGPAPFAAGTCDGVWSADPREVITDQQSRFDTQAFVDTRYTNVSDPVGSILTTGGPDRYLDENWYYSSGLKQTTASGGSLEVSQKVGYENSNSLYFIPPNQGTSRIDLSLTQPLLNGAGRDYNSHGIVLAQIDANIARDQFSKDLQTLLVSVYRDYWNLYLARATLLQKQRLHRQAVTILDELNARRDVDVLQNQIVRARAAVAGRETAMIRAEAEVGNAEDRIRSVVNDTALRGDRPLELIPNQMPDAEFERIDLQKALLAALERRPEINVAAKELRGERAGRSVGQRNAAGAQPGAGGIRQRVGGPDRHRPCLFRSVQHGPAELLRRCAIPDAVG